MQAYKSRFTATFFLLFFKNVLYCIPATLRGFAFLVLQVMNWRFALVGLTLFNLQLMIFPLSKLLDSGLQCLSWAQISVIYSFVGPFSAPLCVLALHIVDLYLMCLGLKDAIETNGYIL